MASIPNIPPGVRAVRNRFEAWRKAKSGREKIPERLWSQAAALGSRHGVNLVSRWLRLNHTALQDRARIATRSRPKKAGTAFIEWRPAVPAPFSPVAAPEYVVELEARPGRVLRVRARGAGVADVAELARRLAEATS
jgi:hypothetical protein